MLLEPDFYLGHFERGNFIESGSDSMFFLKNGQFPASFCLFSSFSQHNVNYSTKFDYKKHRWTRTRGGMMVGADESTELWRHPILSQCYETFLEVI